MRARVGLVVYVGILYVFTWVMLVAPGRALALIRYDRIIEAAEVVAQTAFRRGLSNPIIATAALSPTVQSLALRIVTGPVGWSALGVAAGLTLYQVYYDRPKLDAIKISGALAGGMQVAGSSTVLGLAIYAPLSCVSNCGLSASFDQKMLLLCNGTQGTSTGFCFGTQPQLSGWSPQGVWELAFPQQAWVYWHFTGAGNALTIADGVATQASIEAYLDALAAGAPNAPESNVQTGGGIQPAAETTTSTVAPAAATTGAEVKTAVKPQGDVAPGDVVVQQDVPPPEGTQSSTTSTNTTTTTSTTTVVGDTKTTEEAAPVVSCFSTEHDARTVGSMLTDFTKAQAGSSVLGLLTLLQNLSWPETLPHIQVQTQFGMTGINFNDYAQWFGALRAMVIAVAGLYAVRLVFAGD